MNLQFEVAKSGHEEAILRMRMGAAEDRSAEWTSGKRNARLRTIRERIQCADTRHLRAQTIFVATQEGEPVGSLVLTTFLPSFLKGQLWREPKAVALGVFGLVVSPPLQRHGIGRFLMAGVEDLARSHGIRFVRLDAYETSPGAVSFYRAIGYEERGTIQLRGTPLVLFEKSVG